MINIMSGEIKFNNLILFPHMKLAILKNMVPKEEILAHDSKDGRTNIYLKPQACDSRYFILRLFFEGQNAELSHFLISIQDDSSTPSWENWSEKKQMEIKYANDEWLKSELGKLLYEFVWGNLKSIYNARDGSSYIVVNYK